MSRVVEAAMTVEGIDGLHLPRAQRKVEDLGIIAQVMEILGLISEAKSSHRLRDLKQATYNRFPGRALNKKFSKLIELMPVHIHHK